MRLIDANELLEVIAEQEKWNVPDFVYESIKNAPTIEAEPIKYGTWIKIGMIDRTWVVHRCSACGYQTIDNGQYCTECGARMKEKEL